MKRLKLLTALAIGIMASSSGVVQVKAADFAYYVDFATKEVADFDDYKQSFNADTYNLDAKIEVGWIGSYRFDSCPTAFTVDMSWRIQAAINLGSETQIGEALLPDLPCVTVNTSYVAFVTVALSDAIVLTLMDDDADSVRFRTVMRFQSSAAINGRTLTLSSYENFFDVTYDFNTTYLFNYFLSDHQFLSRSGTVGTWTFNSTQATSLRYVYTTAGNDSYTIFNSNFTTSGTTRKKYAVDYNEEFFRGESVGAGVANAYSVASDTVLFGLSSPFLIYDYRYYYLNTANLAQAIVDAPVFDFEYDDCGSFLALNVGCFINNSFAYITNDAPIVSDAFTLLNAGIEMAAQTFGIIGEFADDNVFGVLILAGFGFIAVKWFLKND